VGKVGVEKAFLDPVAKGNPRAREKILEADLIVIGPGNHYCSIIPNFLVNGIAQSIKKSSAKVVYNCNLVNKRGHTDGYTLERYVKEIESFIGVGRIDFVTFNTRLPAKKIMERYNKENGELVSFESKEKLNRRYRVLQADLLSRCGAEDRPGDMLAATRSFIRHDAEKLAKILMMILELGAYESIIKDIS
jgi:uncharacterized cofD-like protein